MNNEVVLFMDLYREPAFLTAHEKHRSLDLIAR